VEVELTIEEGPEMKEKKREERRDQTMNNTHGGTREIGERGWEFAKGGGWADD
jgi:hypothetical protein